MNECLVFQPFDDGGPFDQRFDQVLQPAVEDAGFSPYRVDRDPNATIPMADLESRLASSPICLADISIDNPNVWFELGYALACRCEVLLICARKRDRFPFDVQHRSIIRYTTDAPGSFDDLRTRITARLQARLKAAGTLQRLASVTPSVAAEGGLEQHEIAALVALAESPEEAEFGLGASALEQRMGQAGFTGVAATLGVHGLIGKEYVEKHEGADWNGNSFVFYRITEAGFGWLSSNMDKLQLTKRVDSAQHQERAQAHPDDVPF